MNKTIKKKWLKALRSDEYEQGQMRLLTTYDVYGEEETEVHRFCCLGVLCQIHAEETGEGWFDEDDSYHPNLRTRYTSRAELPSAVRAWAGLKSGDPEVAGIFFGNKHGTDSLSNLNDSGKTFKQIANVIEKCL